MNAQTKQPNVGDALKELDATPHVYQAINDVQGELAKTGIAKTRKNSQGSGYMFRGIDDVYAALSPLLARHKLVVVPRVLSREVEVRQSKSGGALFTVSVHAEFDFVSSVDGTKHTAATFGEAMDSGDKATNKAMSAAYKYAAFMTFAIPIEGDNDADATTHEVASPNATPRHDPPPKATAITDGQKFDITALAKQAEVTIQTICEAANVSEIDELSETAAASIIKKLRLTLEKKKPAEAAPAGDILDDEVPY